MIKVQIRSYFGWVTVALFRGRAAAERDKRNRETHAMVKLPTRVRAEP